MTREVSSGDIFQKAHCGRSVDLDCWQQSGTGGLVMLIQVREDAGQSQVGAVGWSESGHSRGESQQGSQVHG